ncbi:MAG: hypothetical protein EOP53_20730, partial [Sphingobacteriales bacterium]
MKHIIFLLLIMLQINTAFCGVKTDEPKSAISATVNFKNWQASLVICNRGISGLEFMGMGADKQAISVELNGEVSEGTFEINKNTRSKAAYGTLEDKYTVGAKDFGKVFITKYDKEKN